MTARACPDDLLAMGRRRALSDLERQALTAHLAHCDLCRAGVAAAELLHAEPPADRDGAQRELGDLRDLRDLQMIDGIADRASVKMSRGARRARPGWSRVAVAAIALCAGTGALAWVGTRTLRPEAPAPRATAEAPRLPRAPHRRTTAPLAMVPSAPALEAPPAPTPSVVATPPSAKRRAPARADGPRDTTPAPAATSASLFDEANAVRRTGDLRRAADLYRVLRRQFPGSAQARLASISLGDVMIDLEEPADALRAFDAYLAEVRGGPLREEAMFGRARCLRRLGQDAAERDTWTALLNDFPQSAYEAVARRRLTELRR